MADKRIGQLVEATTMGNDDLLVLEQNGQAKKLSGQNLGDYVYAAAAEKVAYVNSAVADAQDAIDDLMADKDTIAQAVASMAEFGTDTSLSTTGMAADAKATGDAIKTIVEVADSQPESELNEVWIQTSNEDLEIPEMSDLDDISDEIVASKTGLESMIAGREDTMVTTTNYVSGALVVADGMLYKLDANVSSGETLVPSRNCHATTIDSELAAVNYNVSYLSSNMASSSDLSNLRTDLEEAIAELRQQIEQL